MAHSVEDLCMSSAVRGATVGGDEGVLPNDYGGSSVDRRWANGLGAYARSGGDIA
jgi:hypothetical protein